MTNNTDPFENKSKRRLSPAQVRWIRQQNAAGVSKRAIAAAVGTAVWSVTEICCGRTYVWVPEHGNVAAVKKTVGRVAA